MNTKIVSIVGITVAVGGLFLLGRSQNGGATGARNPHTAVISQATIGNAPRRQQAPDFSLQKLGGGTITLSDFRGKKPVVVDFWASWCPNCRRDMPNLNRWYEHYKDQVEVIGVNLQERESAVRDFIASRGITFPIALDPQGRASSAYGIQYTNTHFLIDREGNLVRAIPGDIREADIVSLIEP